MQCDTAFKKMTHMIPFHGGKEKKQHNNHVVALVTSSLRWRQVGFLVAKKKIHAKLVQFVKVD